MFNKKLQKQNIFGPTKNKVFCVPESKILSIPSTRKGQGISINVIIIAAIALLVLVVLSVLLLRGGSNLAEGTDCQGVGGQCTSSCNDLSGDGAVYIKHPTANCRNDGESCCIVLGS